MFKDLAKTRQNIDTADQIILKNNLNPKTFCIVPFTNIILEPDGQVGICRQKGHNFSIGNIKDAPIHEIWNNEKIRAWRQEFLNGIPKICKTDIRHEQCNRCPENNKLLPHTQFSELQVGPILKLTANFNGKCNLQCQMCDVWKLPNGLYDEINFWEPAKKEIFPFLKEIDMLSGEPLIQPDTFRLIDEVSNVNSDCSWTITTNAHWKFNSKIENALDKIKLKTIIISVDSFIPDVYAKIRYPGKLDLVLSNIDEILKYQKKRSDFDIHLNFLVQKDNWREVFYAIEYCYGKKINPFLTFLYEPSEFSLLGLDEKAKLEILEFYLKTQLTEKIPHLKKVILPIIDSLSPINKSYYLLSLHKLICKSVDT